MYQSKSCARQNPSSSDDIENLSPKSDKSLSMVDKKRGKKSPSINTRASRVAVTNFINVVKSLHPGESINYFPITKETLQEYIDSKRKALIKADSPALKSVTVRSKTKVYKQKIAVADTTTFTTLISFAIKVQPPTGKQFVIRAADGALEYMPDDLVREVITGVEHTEIIVCIEDVGPPVNFDYF
ncbi:hypothetical protein RhiirA5_396328 [Rhizophagus irregularis]|uniref:Uncharacterized protein n=1 Tax=Rhizophagus irregularis TaxID=588596 RepID=A0A2N0Q2L9_9GLOM|nr:hypothetical protein RhiirA5_396328 [Rhizophagus irregularis]CAB5390442.1 unnamed protein product [Rhizophagus irregularis]